MNRLRSLYAQFSNNACTLCITAAAGTELAGASSDGTVGAKGINFRLLFPPQQCFTTHRAFFTHAALLRQSFLHCAIFPTAASRRSLGRVSVPVWLIVLSDQLIIFGLVSLYLTNYLMIRELILQRQVFRSPPFPV